MYLHHIHYVVATDYVVASDYIVAELICIKNYP